MAFSYTEQTGDGVTTVFPFTFSGAGIGYIRESDIVVLVNGAETVDFTFSGSNQIQFNSAPPAPVAPWVGPNIMIRRVVPKDRPYADFSRGNNFGQDQMNYTVLQQLYALHEFLDGFLPDGYFVKGDMDFKGNSILGLGNLDMGLNRITGVPSPSLPTDAVPLSFIAEDLPALVEGATTSAVTAIGFADDAAASAAASAGSAESAALSATEAASTLAEIDTQGYTRGEVGKAYRVLSGVVRNVAGVWDFIDDAGHTPTNLLSLTDIDVYTLRVNYGETYGKVSTFTLCPDDALAPYGVNLGSDVGTSFANITFNAPFSCVFSGAGVFTKIAPLWEDYATVTPNGRGFTITHPQTADKLSYGTTGEDAVVVCIEAASSGATNLPMGLVVSGVSRTEFKVHAVDDLNGFVTYSGSAWAQSLSSNLDAPVLSWTASNTLKIAHANVVKNVLPEVNGFGGVYLPQVVNIGPDFFEVAFYDYAGTKILTPNSNMKVSYRRTGPVPSSFPTGLIVNCRRGFLGVPHAGIKNVGGNNFWLHALMEL